MSRGIDHYDAATELMARLNRQQHKPEVQVQIVQAHALLALVEAVDALAEQLLPGHVSQPDDRFESEFTD